LAYWLGVKMIRPGFAFAMGCAAVLGSSLLSAEASTQGRHWSADRGAITLQSLSSISWNELMQQAGSVAPLPFRPEPGQGRADGSWMFGRREGSPSQPGTLPWQPHVGVRPWDGGPACTRYSNGRLVVLPGCRGVHGDGPTPGIPEPAAGLAFGAGALIVAARLRRRR